MDNSRTEVEVAREIVCSYFENLANRDAINAEGLQELFNINFDKSNQVLLEHLKAMRNIFDRAIKEIEYNKKS